MIHIIFLLFLLATLIINFITLYFSPGLGILINSVSIILYAIMAAYDIYDIYAQDILSLSITFICINLINSYLHISDIYTNTIITYLIVCFISLIFCFKIFHEKKLFNLRNLKHSYIIILGPIIGFAIYYFIPFHKFLNTDISSLQAISLITLSAITETIFFQTLIQNAITSMTDNLIAIPYTSILFVLFHFSNNLQYISLFAILSLFYTITYSIWKNVYIALGVNLGINITFFLLTSHVLIFATR